MSRYAVLTTVAATLLAALCLADATPKVEVVKQWNLLNFNFPWDYPASNKEFYNPENIVATGIEVGYDRVFIATPRLFSGVPSTLSTVPRGTNGDSPILQAYPDWTHHRAATKEYNCSEIGLVSVYRVHIDSCNRLWALDAGVSRSLEDYEITCPPKILVYDLHTDQVVRRIDFPREVIRGESLYTNLIVDETTSRPGNNCDDVFVYISDTVAPGIVVYDSTKDLTWRVSHPAMYPDPDFAQSAILEHRFTLMDGIVGLAFDMDAGIVYFQPLATDRIFSVTTAALRAGPLPFGKELPVKLVGRKSSQGIGLAVSPRGGTIFFAPFTETAIASWNPRTNEHHILAKDQEMFQFAADLRTPDRDATALYVLTTKFHRFFLKNLDANEFNTRILRIDSVATPSGKLDAQSHLSPTVPYETLNANNYYHSSVVLPVPYKPLAPGQSYALPPAATTSTPVGVFGAQPLPPLPSSTTFGHSVQVKHPFGPGVGPTKSSFFILNSGEKAFPPPARPHYASKGPTFIPKINLNFNDLNGLRYRKSLPANATVAH
ncbi:major royal jelly protein 1-like [Anopheles albimanus]|uniref:Bee-milk protein n=1 Tax=Anopheles albimanus TaxID=7167 RepID=A0A182F6Q4_ANOAL|nr:major royal jelly protein 1-like [Anopheles albimanus]